MRKPLTWLGAVLTFYLVTYSHCDALPDPRDSIIIQSKSVTVGVGNPATLLRVWITNKDTISNYIVSLVEKSATNGAYMTLAWPRTFDGVVVPLTSTLGHTTFFASNRYNNASPDTIILTGFLDVTDPAGTREPPNAVRKALLDIKFDTIFADVPDTGTVVFDSTSFRSGNGHTFYSSFIDKDIKTVTVNFKKGVGKVINPCPLCLTPSIQWDLNKDKRLGLSDLVLVLNCTFGESRECTQSFTPSDVVGVLNLIFKEEELPTSRYAPTRYGDEF